MTVRMALMSFALLLAMPYVSLLADTEPFMPSVQADAEGQGVVLLTVSFKLSPDAIMHDSDIGVEVPGKTVEFAYGDPMEDVEGELCYHKDFKRCYRVHDVDKTSLEVTVNYSGCLLNGVCLMPQSRKFTVVADGATVGGKSTPVMAGADDAQIKKLEIVSKRVGYMSKDELLGWLGSVEQGRTQVNDERDNVLMRVFSAYGLWLAMLLIIPLGMALNLTPCVLPMIPVTLAVIGVKDARRGRGMTLGGAYGLGMAIAYGTLGCIVVLTGRQFGELNAKPWFNGCVALLFIVLGLAMFDVLSIDFTRFRSGRVSGTEKRGSILGAFLMGGLAAVLAGACVAPVLIWVIVLATDFYSAGNYIGLLLPFLLGVGMGLPWPFLGGGLSKLPRPGQWMVRVRQAIGVLIVALGVYYGVVCWRQLSAGNGSKLVAQDGWETQLDVALVRSRREGKPLFIDFWGISCKNCALMDRTVFKDEEVLKRLSTYIPVKFLADDMDDPMVATAIKTFDVKGFPTFVIVK